MTLGQRIQALRKQHGLSQEGLGERLGVSRQAISRWEMDGAVPEVDKLIAMARLFGVSLNQLLGVEEPEQPVSEAKQVSHGRRSRLLAALCALLSVVLAVSLGFNFYYRYRVLMILDPPQSPSAPVQQVLYAVRPDYETMTYDLALSLTENGGLRGYDTQVSLFTVLPEQPSYQDGNTTVIPAPSYHQEEFPVAFRNKTATLVLENLPFRYHKAAVISLTYSKGELEGTHALLRLEPTGRGIDWIIEAGSSSFGQHPPEIKEEPELLALQ